MKCLLLFMCFFTFSFLNAQQLDHKKLKRLVKKLNENIELIQENRKEIHLESEEYDGNALTVITPFLDYDFEILAPFFIDESGNISMKIKYLDPEGAFIQSINGQLIDLTGFAVDIYFILEFKKDSLLIEYVDLSTGEKEIYKSSILLLAQTR